MQKLLSVLTAIGIVIGISVSVALGSYIFSESQKLGEIAYSEPAQVATGTPTGLTDTSLLNDYSSTTTISFQTGKALRLNILAKTTYATGTVDILMRTSQDAVYWYDWRQATSTGALVIAAGGTLPSLSFATGAAAATTSASFLIPGVQNARFIQFSFRSPDSDGDRVGNARIYAELIKETEL